MNIRLKTLLLPSAVLLSFCLMTSLFCLGKSSARAEPINLLRERSGSVTLKLTMSDGTWIKASEPKNGQIVVRRGRTVLTLSPRVISDNRVAVTLHMISSAGKGPIVFEDLIEIENRTVHRPSRELIEAGLHFDLAVVQIQSASVTRHFATSLAYASFSYAGSGACCVTCNGVTVCGCAVEGSCGSCCTGECCGDHAS